MSYWACAQLEANRERLALHCLRLRGFEVYLPRLRVRRITPARKTTVQAPALFPGYAFVRIELQWHAARWSPGVLRLVLEGDRPARCGDPVCITRGVFAGQLAVFDGMRPHERVAVLLQLLGRIELAQADIASAR